MPASVPRILPGNAQDRGDRDYQEDAFGFTDRKDAAFVRHAGFAAVLCDGMGGLEHGSESAVLGVDTFLDEYRRKLPDETPAAALRRSVLRANDAVYRYARDNGLVQKTGCTLVAVVARGVELHCIHVGDSRAYLFSRGVLERLTTDHTYARRLQLQAEQGQISAAEADNHPRRDHLTSNLGRQELTELEILDPPRKLAPDDWILLCSDGLHGVLSDAEITAELHGNSQDAARRLVERVTARPMLDKDNVTVVLMQVAADGSISPLHQTSRTGVPRSRSGEGNMLTARPEAAAVKEPTAKTESAPRKQGPWIWAASTLPLLLALLVWRLWPSPAPSQPLVHGVQPAASTPPAAAPVQDEGKLTFPVNISPAREARQSAGAGDPAPKPVARAPAPPIANGGGKQNRGAADRAGINKSSAGGASTSASAAAASAAEARLSKEPGSSLSSSGGTGRGPESNIRSAPSDSGEKPDRAKAVPPAVSSSQESGTSVDKQREATSAAPKPDQKPGAAKALPAAKTASSTDGKSPAVVPGPTDGHMP